MIRLFYWPPKALARWVNSGPDRTETDRAFYTTAYCAGWTVIFLAPIIVLIPSFISWLVS